ncbi:MAG TPA: hypothetical protein VMF91_19120 [Bryobacteraceae bacterium]|nr:hypothetical protein [Bryobacteraceae bacterium]
MRTSVLSYLKVSPHLVDKPGVSTSFDDYPQPATILVPSPSGNGAKRSISCAFHGMEGRRLILEAGEPLSPSTALSIEHEDNLFLGEVVACAAQSPGLYRMEIKIEQILTGLHNLMALRARLLGEAVPQTLGLMPVGVLN